LSNGILGVIGEVDSAITDYLKEHAKTSWCSKTFRDLSPDPAPLPPADLLLVHHQADEQEHRTDLTGIVAESGVTALICSEDATSFKNNKPDRRSCARWKNLYTFVIWEDDGAIIEYTPDVRVALEKAGYEASQDPPNPLNFKMTPREKFRLLLNHTVTAIKESIHFVGPSREKSTGLHVDLKLLSFILQDPSIANDTDVIRPFPYTGNGESELIQLFERNRKHGYT